MSDAIIHAESLDILRLIDDETVDFIYIDPPFATQKDRGDYDDRWPSIESFTGWLTPYLAESERILKDTGSIVIHLDYRAIHYVRVAADKIFGYENMLNEIIWNYNSGGAGKRFLARKHDTMIWYAVDANSAYTYNVLREPYATPNVQGRPGFHPAGRMLTDVWNVPIISTTGLERVGYATQKPLKLMERVIEVFTNPGDQVLDFFCGSGTTGVACQKMGRGFWLVDQNPKAIQICEGRLGINAI
jgi:site-specific DNA-methyltransferase (adenine-specific)